MGMDVFGNKPKDEVGEYFRSNVWYWHPLWSMIEDLYPLIAKKVENPHSNDGDGLNNQDSKTLSSLIKRDLQNGKIKEYIDLYDQAVANLEPIDCDYCDQTGYRTWKDDLGNDVSKICNACNGTLKTEHPGSWYKMDYSLIEEFQRFLNSCGGFQIC